MNDFLHCRERPSHKRSCLSAVYLHKIWTSLRTLTQRLAAGVHQNSRIGSSRSFDERNIKIRAKTRRQAAGNNQHRRLPHFAHSTNARLQKVVPFLSARFSARLEQLRNSSRHVNNLQVHARAGRRANCRRLNAQRLQLPPAKPCALVARFTSPTVRDSTRNRRSMAGLALTQTIVGPAINPCSWFAFVPSYHPRARNSNKK